MICLALYALVAIPDKVAMISIFVISALILQGWDDV